MPLSSDVTTGSGPSKSVLDKLKQLAAAGGTGANGVPKSTQAGPVRGSAALEEILAERAGQPNVYGLEQLAQELAEPEVPVPEMLQLGGSRPSPLLADAEERATQGSPASSYDAPSGYSYDGQEKKDIVGELAAEAKAKGIRGRGMQGYIQERTGMPGTEGYLQDELAQRRQVDIDREMVGSNKRAMRQGLKESNAGGVKDIGTEGYQSLTPLQRAAVDLNTLLVEAARSDRKEQPTGKNPGGAEYDALTEKLFGEESKRYAPATASVLDSIGFQNDDVKLKDFFRNDVGFTAADLEDLQRPDDDVAPDASLMTKEHARDSLQESLVKALKSTRNDPARGSALRTTQQQLTGSAKMQGYSSGNAAADEFFQTGFEALAMPENAGQRQVILEQIKNNLAEPDVEWPMFLAYLDTRSREAMQYNLPLGATEGVSYYHPKEFRKELGLND
jgi:hypothetical protein